MTETTRRSYAPGPVIRKILIRASMLSCMNQRLRSGMLSAAGVNFKERRGVWIGDTVYFDNLQPARIHVGKRALITSGTKILSHFFDATHQATEEWPYHFVSGDVRIGDYVFIGAGTIIAKPVTIGDWAIVGANTVVTKDIPSGAIYAGNPGRVTGYRDGFGPAEAE